MKIAFLGTNGWINTYTGNTTCTLVDTKNAYILLDAGSGIYRAYDLMTEEKPVYILLSHLHIDHIEGLHCLSMFNFSKGLTIIVPPAMKQELESILRPPFSAPFKELGAKAQIIEFAQAKNLPFNLAAQNAGHNVAALSYKIEDEGKTLVYTGDTGPGETLANFAQGADLLLAECSLPPGEEAKNPFHLTPGQAAGLALSAGVKMLALTHFAAEVYTSFEKRDEALAAAGAIFPYTMAPYDGDQIEI